MTGLLRTTMSQLDRYRNSYCPGLLGAMSVRVPERAPFVESDQPWSHGAAPRLNSPIQSLTLPVGASQLTLNSAPGATVCELGVSV
jgi:hypothetical protein